MSIVKKLSADEKDDISKNPPFPPGRNKEFTLAVMQKYKGRGLFLMLQITLMRLVTESWFLKPSYRL